MNRIAFVLTALFSTASALELTENYDQLTTGAGLSEDVRTVVRPLQTSSTHMGAARVALQGLQSVGGLCGLHDRRQSHL